MNRYTDYRCSHCGDQYRSWTPNHHGWCTREDCKKKNNKTSKDGELLPVLMNVWDKFTITVEVHHIRINNDNC